jgi:hypothetical protein
MLEKESNIQEEIAQRADFSLAIFFVVYLVLGLLIIIMKDFSFRYSRIAFGSFHRVFFKRNTYYKTIIKIKL